MHSDLLHPSLYLKAADLRGKDVTLKLDAVSIQTLKKAGGKSERKPVTTFMAWPPKARAAWRKAHDMDAADLCPDEKLWPINKTEHKREIAKQHGTEVNDWRGKPLVLFATTCKFGPDTVDCIRIRPAKLVAPKAKSAPEAGS